MYCHKASTNKKIHTTITGSRRKPHTIYAAYSLRPAKQKLRTDMGKKKDYDEMDESEVFKQKNLAASRRRKKIAAIMTVIMYAAAIIVVLACIFAYVFDKT